MEGFRRFVGVGIDEYDSPDFDRLDYAVAEVRAVAGLLRPSFVGEPLVNRTDEEIRDELELLSDTGPDVLVMLWSGHGVAKGGDLKLQTKKRPMRMNDVVEFCVDSGASQLFLVIDTCHSGQGIADASRLASALLAEFPPKNERVWFGVLVSCRAGENACDGAFGKELRRLLSEGPRSPILRDRWRHSESLFGDDLAAALLEDWPDHAQRPEYLNKGRRWFMLPNPLWEPGAPAQVVEHLLLAARGGGDEQSWFSGRVAEVDQVVGWVGEGTPGIRVVTGPAGTGKSAILGRVVSLSNPSERQRLHEQGGWRHTAPGVNSVHAHVHARGLTADLAAGLLDAQLIRRDSAEEHPETLAVLLPEEAGRRNAAELVGALQRAHQGGAKPPVIVVDGLDEARGEAFAIAEDLLVRMAAFAIVIVSTRPLTREQVPQSLLEVLDPAGVVDLDAPAAQDSQRAAIADYVSHRLAGRDPAMNPTLVAQELLDGASSHRESFLLARIVVDQLVVSPVDTALPNWQQHLAHSIGAAFDVDVAKVRSDGFHLLDGADPADLARTLLTALTWALGAGFPEDEWLAVAAALAGAPLNSGHTSWVLDQLGRYVIQDGEAGLVVYRLAHQSLADHLRRPYQPTADQPFDPAAAVVCAALAGRYHHLLQDGHPADAPAYLKRYTGRHAADAGPDGITMLRSLAEQDSALTPDVAAADLSVGDTLAGWGHHHDALPLTEEAVTLFRELAAANPAHLPDLAGALNNLGTSYGALGRHHDALPLAEEAVTLFRELAVANPAYLPALAGTLINFGVRYGALGRPHDALPPAEEAVTIYRELAAANPAHLPNLASALGNFGICYSVLGRPHDALPLTEEAVTLVRELAATNPAHLPNLANALTNFGYCYSELGRHHDALPPVEEAVTRFRELAAANPAHLPGLAGALNNLGDCYSALGRPHDALPPTEEAVTLFRELAAANPAHLPGLALALTNLGVRYSDLGRPHDPLPPTKEAVTLYRELVAANPAHLPGLARALNNLGIGYSELGRPHDALPPTQEAVTLYRELAATNPAQLPDLARALDNLGIRYSELGRPHDALPPAQEAVTLYRELVAANPAHLPDVARALTNLGNAYSALGRPHDALPPAEEAVTLYRELAATNPAHLPNLALALNNLGGHYRDLGRPHDPVPPTEEAVTLFRELAAANPAQLPDVARALTNLGGDYRDLGRHHDALPTVEEAVMIYRELAAANPAHLPGLARALSNLGNCYSALGRPHDALPPAEEAVTIYRDLVATNPAQLPGLAWALTNLDRLLATQHTTDRTASYLADFITTLDPQQRAELKIRMSYCTVTGDVRAAAWLADAADAADPAGDRPLLAAVHDSARNHRSVDPQAWDTAWAEATGQAAPEWLTADTALLATARDWTRTPTCEAQRNHLAAHPELLEPAADTAVDEALLSLSDQDRERYRRIRGAAQTDGVEATYRPLIKDELLHIFGSATLDQQLRLLDEYRNELLDPDVRSQLAEAAEAENASPHTVRADALLTIAADPNGAQVLDQIASALTEPQQWPDLLRAIATNPDIAADRDVAADLLAAAGLIAASVAATPNAVGLALLYIAAASAIAADMDDAVQVLQQAVAAAPDEQIAWITLLAELGKTNSAVLTLIRHLAESRKS